MIQFKKYTVSLTFSGVAAAYHEIARQADRSNLPEIWTFRRHIKRNDVFLVNVESKLYWCYLGNADNDGDLWTPEKLERLYGDRLITILKAEKISAGLITLTRGIYND